MGFNIDISKLQGEWKQWAENADAKGTQDGQYINSVMEVDDVITQALDAGKTAQEIATVISGKTPEEAGSVKAKPDKQGVKDMQRDAFAQLSTLNYTGNWDDIASNMTASMLSPTQSVEKRIYCSQLAIQVRNVTNAFKNFPCNSKEDIKVLEDKVKQELKIADNDEFKDFKLDLIEELVDKAEARQKEIEMNNLNVKFKDCREAEGKSREGALDTIKDHVEFQGSYYKDLMSDLKSGAVLDDAREEVWDAISVLKGSRTIQNSKDIENAVVAILKKQGKYDKYTKKVLRGELSLGEKLKWDRSQVKAYRKKTAAENRAIVAMEKAYTEDEIRGEFKKKHRSAFKGLVSNEVTITAADGTQTKGTLVTEQTDEKGNVTYNITNLSNLIRRRIGADLRANKQKSELSPYSEIENIRQEISAACGVDITKKEARHLIKLCGYDVESKNWAQVFYDAVVGTVVDTVPTALGLLWGKDAVKTAATYAGKTAGTVAFEFSKELPVTYNITNKNHIEMLLDVGSGTLDERTLKRSLIMSGFKAGDFTFEYTDEGIKVIIDHADLYSGEYIHNFKENFSKEISLEDLGIDPNQYETDGKIDIASILSKTALISFGMNFLQAALKEKGELPIATTQFDETDINQYLAKLSRNRKVSPTLFKGLSKLAWSFMPMKDGKPIEGAKWNSEGFKRLLNRMAGDESFFNKYEAAIGAYEAAKNPHEEPVTYSAPVTPPPAATDDPVVDETTEVKYEKRSEDMPAREYTPGSVKFTAWQDLVNGYSSLSDAKYNVRLTDTNGYKVTLNNRMVKVLQTFDLTGVPEGVDVKDVYDVNLIAEFTKVCIEQGIDAALADDRFKNLPVNKQKYEELVGASAGVKGNVVIPDLYDDGNKVEWKENGRVKIKKGGTTTATVDTTTRVVKGQTLYFRRPAGNPDAPWEKISKEEYDKIN